MDNKITGTNNLNVQKICCGQCQLCFNFRSLTVLCGWDHARVFSSLGIGNKLHKFNTWENGFDVPKIKSLWRQNGHEFTCIEVTFPFSSPIPQLSLSRSLIKYDKHFFLINLYVSSFYEVKNHEISIKLASIPSGHLAYVGNREQCSLNTNIYKRSKTWDWVNDRKPFYAKQRANKIASVKNLYDARLFVGEKFMSQHVICKNGKYSTCYQEMKLKTTTWQQKQ